MLGTSLACTQVMVKMLTDRRVLRRAQHNNGLAISLATSHTHRRRALINKASDISLRCAHGDTGCRGEEHHRVVMPFTCKHSVIGCLGDVKVEKHTSMMSFVCAVMEGRISL